MRIPKDGDVYTHKIQSDFKCHWKMINGILNYSVALLNEKPEFWHIAKEINISDMQEYWILDNSLKIKKRLGIK